MARSSRPPPPPKRPSKKLVDREALESVLETLVEDPHEREFIARCIAREGPPHHQAASYALLRLLAEVSRRMGAVASPASRGKRTRVHVAPHHARDDDDEREFSLALPEGALARIEPDPKRRAAFEDALLDGPTHHALANVAMVALIEAILVELDRRGER
ncbi:MAG: hypothetical protein JNK05_00060 [Myxococcales bacterium]|nr:hypothetical protein [Myxococcales bacterium]